MSDSSRVALRYVLESTFGTTPASALKDLRYTSEGLQLAADTVISQEIRSDRQIPNVIRTAQRAEGPTSHELTYATFDEIFQMALGADWQVGVPSAGNDLLENAALLKSATIEKEFVDVASAFQPFTGMRCGRFDMNVGIGAIATLGFGFTGQGSTPAASTAGTGAPTAAPANTPMTAIEVTSINENSGAVTKPVETSFSLTNALRPQHILGSAEPDNVGVGRCAISGSVVALFSSLTLINQFVNDAVSDLDFTLTDAEGNLYTFTFPRIKYTAGTVLVGGIDQDVPVRLDWAATRDTTADAMIQIIRNPV